MKSIMSIVLLLYPWDEVLDIRGHSVAAEKHQITNIEEKVRVKIKTSLREGLIILKNNPDVLYIKEDDGDIDLSLWGKGAIKCIVGFKKSDDALFIVALPGEDGGYIIEELILYENWELDSKKPKKFRKGKRKYIQSFP